ncbi:gamma-glutamyl-gamma-aminobutyrate hydrolase family protein [Herbaspirillum sp.]|uniref:gamma-glutamyl-gamma-aminobutyrate hydrolase family protein n=1 Tax=Herbaspirillum sp. TaxID=1890675 RepID=UPI0031D826AA
MRPLVAISCRVQDERRYVERRDALDQRWPPFLHACGLTPILLPNHMQSAREIMRTIPVSGVILSGGDSLVAYGGHTPERDAVEQMVLAHCVVHGLPVIGVCRGMQVLLHDQGGTLAPLENHVATEHVLDNGRVVNSYHTLGLRSVPDGFEAQASAMDGSIEALCHARLPWWGMMWHPERATDGFAKEDIALFRHVFGVDLETQGTTQ